MSAVHRGRFPVDRFIAEIAAGEFALLPVFLLLLHDSLRCPLTSRPLAADLDVGRPADVDRFVLDRVARPECAAIAENGRQPMVASCVVPWKLRGSNGNGMDGRKIV